MWPISGVDAYSALAICADVIVNGANASTFTLDAPQLSSEQPCKGVILSGNSHCVDAVRCVQPGENLSSTVVAGVILASAEGVIMQANVASGCQEHYPTQRCVAVVGGNRSGVSLDMNEGWLAGDFSGWDLLGTPRRLAALKTTDASAEGQDGEMKRHLEWAMVCQDPDGVPNCHPALFAVSATKTGAGGEAAWLAAAFE
jgi:hypothetical protein